MPSYTLDNIRVPDINKIITNYIFIVVFMNKKGLLGY